MKKIKKRSPFYDVIKTPYVKDNVKNHQFIIAKCRYESKCMVCGVKLTLKSYILWRRAIGIQQVSSVKHSYDCSSPHV
jgi:hypothetical protein